MRRLILAAIPLLALGLSLRAGDEDEGVLTEEGFKKLHELSKEERPAPKGEMIGLGDGAKAYLSLPEGDPPFPAILVVHEWWGLNRHIKYWADRLAADGYAALAVDLYDGKVATDRDAASRYMNEANRDPEKAKAILRRAHGHLRVSERIQAPRTGSIGWCFGGGWSLETALQTPELDAAVVYYGKLETDPEKLKAIRAAVLGVFANEDRWITPKLVNEFEKGLERAGVTHRILRYDAAHAFANPSSGRYDEEAAEDAWKKVRAFLAKHLGK